MKMIMQFDVETAQRRRKINANIGSFVNFAEIKLHKTTFVNVT